jgi:hypothetical protein
LDQLACEGGGELFGVALSKDNFEQAHDNKVFLDEYYLVMEISKNAALTSLTDGQMTMNYMVQMVE